MKQPLGQSKEITAACIPVALALVHPLDQQCIGQIAE
jgi:hypothetical protein